MQIGLTLALALAGIFVGWFECVFDEPVPHSRLFSVPIIGRFLSRITGVGWIALIVIVALTTINLHLSGRQQAIADKKLEGISTTASDLKQVSTTHSEQLSHSVKSLSAIKGQIAEATSRLNTTLQRSSDQLANVRNKLDSSSSRIDTGLKTSLATTERLRTDLSKGLAQVESLRAGYQSHIKTELAFSGVAADANFMFTSLRTIGGMNSERLARLRVMIDQEGEVVNPDNHAVYKKLIEKTKKDCANAIAITEAFMTRDDISALLSAGDMKHEPLFESVALALGQLDVKVQPVQTRQLLVNLTDIEFAVWNLEHWVEHNHTLFNLALNKARVAFLSSPRLQEVLNR